MKNFIFIKLAEVVINPNQLTGLPKTSPDHSLKAILQIVFAVAGAVAVLIITIAGLQMVVSQGNPDSVNKARNAVIYAAVGLAVCVLAFSIVTFVLGQL